MNSKKPNYTLDTSGSVSRRGALKLGGTALTTAALNSVIPDGLHYHIPDSTSGRNIGRAYDHTFATIQQKEKYKLLAVKGVDSAVSAGAHYADSRITHNRRKQFALSGISANPNILQSESICCGVRALVNGYWGFASGTVVTGDELARLGREAVEQARTNSLGVRRIAELTPVPLISDGYWETPIRINPFDISMDEVLDLLHSLNLLVSVREKMHGSVSCVFNCHEKTFASSEGTRVQQTLFMAGGQFLLSKNGVLRSSNLLRGALAGWEYLTDAPLREQVPVLAEQLRRDIALPLKPAELDRKDVVLDPVSMSRLIAVTLGQATELDRAMGYEANSTGTTYLNEPLSMLGEAEVAAPIVTLTGNRNTPDEVASVAWDDDGVPTSTFNLVKSGILRDFQTTRETASWLADSYSRYGIKLRSNGCAAASDALFAPLIYPPNLTLMPGPRPLNQDDLIKDMADGILVENGLVGSDFQALNGSIRGTTFEIKKGKPTARIGGAHVLFRSPELLKGISELGGDISKERLTVGSSKGEPQQSMIYTVTSVPALISNLTINRIGGPL